MASGKKRKQGFDLMKTIKTIEKAASTAMKTYKDFEPLIRTIRAYIRSR